MSTIKGIRQELCNITQQEAEAPCLEIYWKSNLSQDHSPRDDVKDQGFQNQCKDVEWSFIKHAVCEILVKSLGSTVVSSPYLKELR